MATATMAGTRAPARGTHAHRRGEDEAPGDDDQGGGRLAGADGARPPGPVAAGPVLPRTPAGRGRRGRRRSLGPDHAAGRIECPAAGAGTPQGKLVRDRPGIGQETDQDHCRRHQGDVPRTRCARSRRCDGRARGWSDCRSSGTGRRSSSMPSRARRCSAQEALFHYFRPAVARPRRAFGMVLVSPEADDRRGQRGPDTGAGAVRGR